MVLLRKGVGIRLAFMLEISAEYDQVHQYLQTPEDAHKHPQYPRYSCGMDSIRVRVLYWHDGYGGEKYATAAFTGPDGRHTPVRA